jgi:hypothetical protein
LINIVFDQPHASHGTGVPCERGRDLGHNGGVVTQP